MTKRPQPLALIILDGWGYREEREGNAIAQANTPYWNALWNHYPHTLISGCGRCVGLPDGQMGNSEVGHLNIGAGRIVHQDLTRIDLAIEDGSFLENPALIEGIDHAVKTNHAIHILGLLSSGGVHSHENHLLAMLAMATKRQATHVYLHAFLDGRDTPPCSAQSSIDLIDRQFDGKIASIIGRYYAMDRDNRWERVQQAYDLLTLGKAPFSASSATAALRAAYERGETDEFVKPTTIHAPGKPAVTIKDGDTVIFMNFRADRARELTRAFVDETFTGFQRNIKPNISFISLTEYDKTLKTSIVFPPEPLKNILGEHLSRLGLKQLRIAETEKYAHITFFFNGGIETPYPGEDRILIPSPKVATYDLKPEMSALEVTEQLVNAINNNNYDVIICNFANPDMVGHTGNLPATIQAIETMDHCLKRIIDALQAVGGEAIITADHGNAEMMFNHETNQPHTAHTHELVPMLYVGRDATISKKEGILSDIAPTMLYLLGLTQPKEMTGQSLIILSDKNTA